METSTTTPLLHGIRVLDFGRYIAADRDKWVKVGANGGVKLE